MRGCAPTGVPVEDRSWGTGQATRRPALTRRPKNTRRKPYSRTLSHRFWFPLSFFSYLSLAVSFFVFGSGIGFFLSWNACRLVLVSLLLSAAAMPSFGPRSLRLFNGDATESLGENTKMRANRKEAQKATVGRLLDLIVRKRRLSPSGGSGFGLGCLTTHSVDAIGVWIKTGFQKPRRPHTSNLGYRVGIRALARVFYKNGTSSLFPNRSCLRIPRLL